MDTLDLSDPRNLEAIGILADVMDNYPGVMVLQLSAPSKALRVALATQSDEAYELARQNFNQLTASLRRDLARRADTMAQTVMMNRQGIVSLAKPANQSAEAPSAGNEWFNARSAAGRR